MAIRPEFSQAILNGTKSVEFRKRAPASDIKLVLIYETSPTKKIVGIFRVSEIIATSPSLLWQRCRREGAIDRVRFDEYFGGAKCAVGLRVEDYWRLPVPVGLSSLNPSPATPQSFSYLPESFLAQLDGALPNLVATDDLLDRQMVMP